MDKLANMKAFRAVAQTRSFAEAARRLGLATSVVSKRVKDLEGFLGAQLFVRTTRKVALTDTGFGYLDYVRQFLDDLEEVEESIRHKTAKPIGEIKLAAPLSFGVQYLGPVLAAYLAKYPDVSVKTFLSDRTTDIVEEGYDLVIRIGQLKDSSLIAKKLVSCRRIICASPAYFEKYGRPTIPKDLSKHNCLSYTNVADGKAWSFYVDGRVIWQPVSGRFASDNGDLLCEAAISGCGITVLPTFIAGQAIKSGALEVVLKDFEEPDFAVYALHQNRHYLSAKTRTLLDFLSAHFKGGL